MAESSLPWGGAAVGDCGPYTDDQWSDMQRMLFNPIRETTGVIDIANYLDTTNPAGVTIRMGTGWAIVDGKVYRNSASIDFTIVQPVSGSNYYSLVLRKDFTAQTVRAVMLGPNVSSYPAVTQTDGTTWELLLYQIRITSAGTVTLVDQRQLLGTIVSDRQGGSSTDWGSTGANNYKPSIARMQVGVTTTPFGGGGSVTVTFPKAFTAIPVVVAIPQTAGAALMVALRTISATQVEMTVYDHDGAAVVDAVVHWIAIGPM